MSTATGDPLKSYAPDALDTSKNDGARQQEGNLCFIEEQQEEVEKHPLVIWTEFVSGDIVSLRVHKIGDCVGTVESKTGDGLIIWIRDDMNERKLFHFRDCQTVRLLS
jgi:hypothetical protein